MAANRTVTPRQREALAWLHTVGKATKATLDRHGFREVTMNALVNRGMIWRESVGRSWEAVHVWRPVDDDRDGFAIVDLNGKQVDFVDCRKNGSNRDRVEDGLLRRVDFDRFNFYDTRTPREER